MTKHQVPEQPAPREQATALESPEGRTPWQEPKLTFVEPRLTRHGDVKLTGDTGFFGTFVP